MFLLYLVMHAYYRRNLKKEVEPSTVQTALVQDSKPIKDQGITNSIDSHSNSRMSKNDKSKTNSTDSHTNNKASENDDYETAIPDDMDGQGSIDGVIVDRENKISENEVVVEHTENEIKSNYSENISRYDPSLDLPTALRKSTTSCTKHSISNYLSYENLSPQFRAFTVSLDSTTIQGVYIQVQSIHSNLGIDYAETFSPVANETLLDFCCLLQ